MRKDFYNFVESRNLVNRIYDMVYFFGVIKSVDHEKEIKKFFKQRLRDVEYVESLAKYFENRINRGKKSIELKYNLRELVYDLDYLKQYIL